MSIYMLCKTFTKMRNAYFIENTRELYFHYYFKIPFNKQSFIKYPYYMYGVFMKNLLCPNIIPLDKKITKIDDSFESLITQM